MHTFSFNYSRLPLSRLRSSRIAAYLEVKICSLFKHENLTTGKKILWKRGEIASNFHNIFNSFFNISLTSGVKLHNHLWNMVVRFIFSSTLQTWYVEVRICRSISESPLDFEITRVDSMQMLKSQISLRTGKPNCLQRYVLNTAWSGENEAWSRMFAYEVSPIADWTFTS